MEKFSMVSPIRTITFQGIEYTYLHVDESRIQAATTFVSTVLKELEKVDDKLGNKKVKNILKM